MCRCLPTRRVTSEGWLLEPIAWRQISLTSKALDGALKAGTKEAMAKKVDPEAEANVLQFRKTPLSEQFSGEALEIYRNRMKELFRHDLGYDLMNLPKA